MIPRIRTYSELLLYSTFEERFEYLKLSGIVGESTFGYDRWINQKFYHSNEWRNLRNFIIVRDNGCDLGIKDREIFDRILIHHMNPLLVKDISDSNLSLNPEYLITTSYDVHRAIHYGDASKLKSDLFIERTLNDTCPWKNSKWSKNG